MSKKTNSSNNVQLQIKGKLEKIKDQELARQSEFYSSIALRSITTLKQRNRRATTLNIKQPAAKTILN